MDTFWITVLIAGAILFIGLILWTQSRRKKFSPQDHARLKKHWNTLKTHPPEKAILEADKLLDEALKLKGYKGSLGEKLKSNGSLFTDLSGLWSAHKLRNRLAHELNVQLGTQEANRALQQFERGLRDLGLNL